MTRVLREGTAAGLQVGDIITAIDGTAIQASQPSDSDLFATMIRQYRIGSIVELSVRRGAEDRKVSVTLDASPRLPREMKKYEDREFEFRVRDMAAADRTATGPPEGQPGVLVEVFARAGGPRSATWPTAHVILTIDGDSDCRCSPPCREVSASQAKNLGGRHESPSRDSYVFCRTANGLEMIGDWRLVMADLMSDD